MANDDRTMIIKKFNINQYERMDIMLNKYVSVASSFLLYS